MPLSQETCKRVPCPLAKLLLPLLEQCVRSPEESSGAEAALDLPFLALNTILSQEIQLQENVVLNIINRMEKELPKMFRKKDGSSSAQQFHRLVVDNMREDGNLKPFTENELRTLESSCGAGVEKLMEGLKAENAALAESPPDRLEQLMNTLCITNGNEQENRSQVLVTMEDIDCLHDAERSMLGLSRIPSLHEAKFYLRKMGVVEIEGRRFSKMDGQVKLLPGMNLVDL